MVNAYWAGSEVVVLRRDADRKLVRESHPAEHSCFIPKTHVTEKHLRELRQTRAIAAVIDDGPHWRLKFYQRKIALRAAEKEGWFASAGIPVLEADVDPVRRWITDNPVEIAKPRRAYIDLETDSRVPFSRGEEARILCWSIVDHDGARLARLLEEDTDDAERALLRELFRALAPYDSVLAWNGDRFDFPRIGARAAKLGIGIELRRWLWLDHMKLFNKFNVSAAESGDEKQFAGLGSVATSVLGSEEGEKQIQLGRLGGPTTWGMWEAGGTERQELLEYCLDDSDKMRKIEDKTGYVELLETLCQSTHTLPDSRGMMPTRYVEGFLLRLGASLGMRFASRVWEEDAEEPEQYKGAFVLEPTQLGIVRDVHVCDFARQYPSIIQSWNMSPETVVDFTLVETRAMRPAYLSHLPDEVRAIPEGCCAAPLTNVVFRNEPQGVLAMAVTEILTLRKHWDDIKKSHAPGTPEWKDADRRSTAYKNITNAFYGVVGSIRSRFFVREVAESISQTAAWMIQETIKAIEARGWRAIYADTDSAFVVGCTREEFGRFVLWCDEHLYPKLVASKGCTRNTNSLAYEKAFSVLVMLGKKQYAGRYLHFKGKDAKSDSKPEIKGLEFKRGDSARAGRRMQAEVVKKLLDGDDDPAEYEAIVERYRHKVLELMLERDDVVLSKRLSKSLKEYAEKFKKEPPANKLAGCRVLLTPKKSRPIRGRVVHATKAYVAIEGKKASEIHQRSNLAELLVLVRQSPHIEVARALEEQGRDVGAGVRIEYVVVDDDVDPPVYASAESWTPGAAFDRYYLWESMVYPPTARVLKIVFKAVDWRRWERVRPPKAAKVDPKVGELFARELPKARPIAPKIEGQGSPEAKSLAEKLLSKVEKEREQDRRWKQRNLF